MDPDVYRNALIAYLASYPQRVKSGMTMAANVNSLVPHLWSAMNEKANPPAGTFIDEDAAHRVGSYAVPNLFKK